MTMILPLIQQHDGFAFDSNNFAMTSFTTSTFILPQLNALISEWNDDNEGDKEKKQAPIEIDPDLEYGDEHDDGDQRISPFDEGEEETNSEDEDEFEQYLFGENED